MSTLCSISRHGHLLDAITMPSSAIWGPEIEIQGVSSIQNFEIFRSRSFRRANIQGGEII